MRWLLVQGDILDIPADVLVCSANVYLTLSGGVGGAFALRYGDEMQKQLNFHLLQLRTKHVTPGTMIALPGCGSPYKAVLHAVAVDAFYESSADRVASLLIDCLNHAAYMHAQRVVFPALATGYGHLTLTEFADGLKQVLKHSFPGLHEAVLCSSNEVAFAELQTLLPQFTTVERSDLL